MTRHALLGLLLVMVSTPAAAARLRAETVGSQLWLVKANQRLLYWDFQAPAEPREVALPGGYRVVTEERISVSTPRPGVLAVADNSTVTVTRRGGAITRLLLSQVFGEWLKNEPLWGGHKRANDLAYLHYLGGPTGGGINGKVQDLVPAGRSALAILNWYQPGPSQQPIRAQFLVRIDPTAPSPLVPLRELQLPGYGWGYGGFGYVPPPPPRLFSFAGKLLLYERPPQEYDLTKLGTAPPAELREIDAAGRPLRRYTSIPASLAPGALLDHRWLLLESLQPRAKGWLWLLDLRTRRLRKLPGAWNVPRLPDDLSLPETGRYFLVAESRGPLTTITSVISVPSGRRRRLGAGAGGRIRGNLAIVAQSAPDNALTLSVYDVRTGRRLQILRARQPEAPH